MLDKIKQGFLIVCPFPFLFVVIGGGLHLNPGGAFLAAATGTPLVICFFNRWSLRRVEDGPFPSSRSPGSVRSVTGVQVSHARDSEIETAIRQ